ncbi:TonB-dependent siderophore receptor [Amorphus sp. 3PC139-8]|uniref:TonB-dependent siderophore receptor n=1 Tax=Amorphus sp. 3PC139-8 TaxID=2735676 RepID=UPI00345DC7BB
MLGPAVAAILTGGVLGAGGNPALAQSATPEANRQQTIAFAIPPQDLGSALTRFADRASLRLLFPSSLVAGHTSPGVSGTLTTDQALSRLLAGSGLTYRFTSANSVTVLDPSRPNNTRQFASDGTVPLERIDIQGRIESAWGPVDGIVAQRSASGTKTDTPIIETPQSISVVTADQVRQQDASSLAESLTYTPGVTTQSEAFSRMADDFMIRGFNVANGNLGLLRDGMKLQSNVYDGSQEPYGLERVEVLRGPSSVLYGQLAPGGVVNTVSKRPTAAPLRELNVEYGSNDRKVISGDFGGPLTEDGTLTYRLTGLGREADTWIDDIPDNKVYIAPALTWSPDAATSLTLLGSYQHVNTRFVTPIQFADASAGTIPRDMFLGTDGFDRYIGNMTTVGGEFEHAFDSGLTFRTKARYFSADVDWDYMLGSLAPTASTGGLLSRIASARTDRSSGITSDTNLQYDFDWGPSEHTLLAGADFYHRTYKTDRYRGSTISYLDLQTGQQFGGPNVDYSNNRGSDSKGDQFGVYLQDQITIFDKLVLSLGGRHDWSESRSESYRSGSVTKQDDSAFTGRAGAVYLFDSGVAPYVSVSQSFQPQVGTETLSGDALEPSEGVQYEAGVRYQPPETNLLLSAAAYDLTQNNVVTTDSLGFTYQYGKVRSRGVELEARVDMGDLRLIAAYAYTDAEVAESARPAEVGQQIPLTPYNTFSLWADYRLDRLKLPGLTVGGGVRYVGETNIQGIEEDVPSYVLLDAMASLDLGDLRPELDGAALQLNVHNLLDEDFYTCSYVDGCRYGEPRSVALRLSYQW